MAAAVVPVVVVVVVVVEIVRVLGGFEGGGRDDGGADCNCGHRMKMGATPVTNQAAIEQESSDKNGDETDGFHAADHTHGACQRGGVTFRQVNAATSTRVHTTPGVSCGVRPSRRHLSARRRRSGGRRRRHNSWPFVPLGRLAQPVAASRGLDRSHSRARRQRQSGARLLEFFRPSLQQHCTVWARIHGAKILGR